VLGVDKRTIGRDPGQYAPTSGPHPEILAATIIEKVGEVAAEKIARELLEQLGLTTPARKKSKTKSSSLQSQESAEG
jgi:hypothetical protein